MPLWPHWASSTPENSQEDLSLAMALLFTQDTDVSGRFGSQDFWVIMGTRWMGIGHWQYSGLGGI